MCLHLVLLCLTQRRWIVPYTSAAFLHSLSIDLSFTRWLSCQSWRLPEVTYPSSYLDCLVPWLCEAFRRDKHLEIGRFHQWGNILDKKSFFSPLWLNTFLFLPLCLFYFKQYFLHLFVPPEHWYCCLLHNIHYSAPYSMTVRSLNEIKSCDWNFLHRKT